MVPDGSSVVLEEITVIANGESHSEVRNGWIKVGLPVRCYRVRHATIIVRVVVPIELARSGHDTTYRRPFSFATLLSPRSCGNRGNVQRVQRSWIGAYRELLLLDLPLAKFGPSSCN